MDDAEHSKLPWKIDDGCNRSNDILSTAVPEHGRGNTLARCYGPDREANAQYIVEACNIYPDFIKACQDFYDAEGWLPEQFKQVLAKGEQ